MQEVDLASMPRGMWLGYLPGQNYGVIFDYCVVCDGTGHRTEPPPSRVDEWAEATGFQWPLTPEPDSGEPRGHIVLRFFSRRADAASGVIVSGGA